MSSKIRFGQDWPVKVYVEPSSGLVGTLFRFKATQLSPGSKIEVSIIAPERKRFLLGSKSEQVYNGSAIADRSGNIALQVTAQRNWRPGTYTFSIAGTFNGRKVTKEAYFDLMA